ncbi:Ubiquitin domaincontaining protein [Gracilaria domingensis]|nr:Ubiquitin domaincontaining protein [Gracilaria domingensis]
MGCASSKDAQRGRAADLPEWDGHLRAPRAWRVEPAISTQHLTRLRNEFWETRIEGRSEMWQALRFAAEAESVRFAMLSLPTCKFQVSHEMFLTSFVFLGRACIRRGTMQSMFDELGALYEVPMYALVDPSNLDQQPMHEEFKDAAKAVTDYVNAHDKSRRTPRVL